MRGRLRAIEGALRGGPCPECKLPPDGPGRIVLDDHDHEPPEDPGERCPGCGRFLWLVIKVVYEGEEDAGPGDPEWPPAPRGGGT